MLKITKYSKIYVAFSAVLTVAAIVLILVFGLNLGIDFKGGALLEYRFEEGTTATQLRDHLDAQDYSNARVQSAEDSAFLIKLGAISNQEKQELVASLQECCGAAEEIRYENIGPSIGQEILRDAWWQILLVLIAIVLYIIYTFRKISKSTGAESLKPWKMGFATIMALVHDILIPTGVFAVLGTLYGLEIDTFFVTALLTILGFSVHDTIVVFDRIRENLSKYKYKGLSTIIDYSVSTTLARSINTSSTLIFVLLALMFFGGSTTFYFVLALLIGVLSGTYSSIFIAGPILYLVSKK